MDKNVVLDILRKIKNKIQESTFVDYTKDIRHNIDNSLKKYIDTLSKKLKDPKNYIESNVQNYEENIENSLEDFNEELKRNEAELPKLNFRIESFQSLVDNYEKLKKSLKKSLESNTKSKQAIEPGEKDIELAQYAGTDVSKLANLFDEQQLYDTYTERLDNSKWVLKLDKAKKDKLEKRNQELEKAIEKCKKIVEDFSIDRENSVDDLEMKRDDRELAIYENSLAKYKSFKNAFTNSYEREIDELISDYSNDVITFEQLKEKLLILNEKLNVNIEEKDEKSLIPYAKDVVETLKLKVAIKKNYESDAAISSEDADILNKLKDKKISAESKWNHYKSERSSLVEQIESLDKKIASLELKVSELEDRRGRFISTVETEKDKEIAKQIEIFNEDIKCYKELRKEYDKDRKELERNIIFAKENKEKYEKEYNSRKQELESRKVFDAYQREMDLDRIKVLESCLLILEFNADMINVSIKDELEELQASKVEKEPLYDNNGNQIPSFVKDELDKQEEVEEQPVEEETPVEEEVPEVEPAQDLPSFVYEQLEKEEQQEETTEPEVAVEDTTTEEVQETVEETPTTQETVETSEEDKGEELKELTHEEIEQLAEAFRSTQQEVNPSIDINLGDENISFEQTNSDEYKEIDGNEFVDDGIIHFDLARQVRSDEYIGKLNSFFLEQQESLDGEVEEERTEEITVDNNGEEYSFDLGNQDEPQEETVFTEEIEPEPTNKPVQEEQEDPLKEFTLDELKELQKEYKGGSYGK